MFLQLAKQRDVLFEFCTEQLNKLPWSSFSPLESLTLPPVALAFPKMKPCMHTPFLGFVF